MKTTSIAAAALLLASSSLAAPTDGLLGKLDKANDRWRNHKGWKNDKCDDGPIKFTSNYHVIATPDQVVNGTTPTGGLAGAKGFYDLGVNTDLNLICYYIKLEGFRGQYQSPALTATHIHEAAKGQSGPPRIAFPNPVGDEKLAISVGCLQGPFRTGVNDTAGKDTGASFHVRQIEQNPKGFFADVHSSLAVPGAVRGQIGY